MSMPVEEAMERYEAAKLEIRALEKICDELKPIILTAIPDDTNVVTEKGYFYIQKKPKYTYTPSTQQAEEALKEKKKEEEAKGLAKVTYSNVLYFKEGEPTVK